jgi:hypothetical protein
VNTTDSERFQMFDKSKRRTEKKLTPLKWELQTIPTTATRSTAVDMAVKLRINPREGLVCSSCGPQNLWPLFNVVCGGSSTKILHVRIHFTFSGWVAILLSCQQLCS